MLSNCCGFLSQHLDLRRFDFTFLQFQISRTPACLMVSEVGALSCISNTAATVGLSGIKIYVHVSITYSAQSFTVIVEIALCGLNFKVCNNQ